LRLKTPGVSPGVKAIPAEGWAGEAGRAFHSSHPTGGESPLRDDETVVHLLAATTTVKRLKVTCRLDRRKHAVGRKVADETFAKSISGLMRFMANGIWGFNALLDSRGIFHRQGGADE
jgi:hypothetical protein